MTLADLIAQFRAEADDRVQPYLWGDAEVVGYLNDAENEACIRSGLLTDETTPGLAALLVLAGQAWYPLDTRVLDIARARFVSGQSWGLCRTSPAELDLEWPGWETYSSGPRRYYVDGEQLRLVPAPSVPGALALRVSRLPLAPLSLSAPSASPEIPLPDQARLLDWALFRAFSRRDSETYDPNRAVSHEARFAGHFGPRPSARARRNYREAAPHHVRYHGF